MPMTYSPGVEKAKDSGQHNRNKREPPTRSKKKKKEKILGALGKAIQLAHREKSRQYR